MWKIYPVITGSGEAKSFFLFGYTFCAGSSSRSTVLRKFHSTTDVAIEVGGEDAKIIYFEGTIEQRMNGICGRYRVVHRQMASLLKTDANGLNELYWV